MYILYYEFQFLANNFVLQCLFKKWDTFAGYFFYKINNFKKLYLRM